MEITGHSIVLITPTKNWGTIIIRRRQSSLHRPVVFIWAYYMFVLSVHVLILHIYTANDYLFQLQPYGYLSM